MKRPLFSCVMPVKGSRPYVDVALESLRCQGMDDDLEIIIQDGNFEPDEGQSDALNKGFAKAKGAWLFWLNADDVLLPEALNRAIRTIEQSNNSLDWIAGNMVRIDEGGRIISCVRGNGWHDWLYRHAVPHVHGPSAFFRRELFEQVGGFDTSLNVCMDWDLWIRFMRAGSRFVRMHEYIWAMRRWEGSKTQRTKTADENQSHQAEVSQMLKKNAFQLTASGVRLLRLWRILNGNYLMGVFDGLKNRGKLWQDL